MKADKIDVELEVREVVSVDLRHEIAYRRFQELIGGDVSAEEAARWAFREADQFLAAASPPKGPALRRTPQSEDLERFVVNGLAGLDGARNLLVHLERVVEAMRRERDEALAAQRAAEVEAFQLASGLCAPPEERGGDPSGVKPHHVERFLDEATREAAVLRRALEPFARLARHILAHDFGRSIAATAPATSWHHVTTTEGDVVITYGELGAAAEVFFGAEVAPAPAQTSPLPGAQS